MILNFSEKRINLNQTARFIWPKSRRHQKAARRLPTSLKSLNFAPSTISVYSHCLPNWFKQSLHIFRLSTQPNITYYFITLTCRFLSTLFPPVRALSPRLSFSSYHNHPPHKFCHHISSPVRSSKSLVRSFALAINRNREEAVRTLLVDGGLSRPVECEVCFPPDAPSDGNTQSFLMPSSNRFIVSRLLRLERGGR